LPPALKREACVDKVTQGVQSLVRLRNNIYCNTSARPPTPVNASGTYYAKVTALAMHRHGAGEDSGAGGPLQYGCTGGAAAASAGTQAPQSVARNSRPRVLARDAAACTGCRNRCDSLSFLSPTTVVISPPCIALPAAACAASLSAFDGLPLDDIRPCMWKDYVYDNSGFMEANWCVGHAGASEKGLPLAWRAGWAPPGRLVARPARCLDQGLSIRGSSPQVPRPRQRHHVIHGARRPGGHVVREALQHGAGAAGAARSVPAALAFVL
jgi:hypothetical protein